MGSFIISLELINRKKGGSFPRHQQYQQLGSERAQGLAVDQLDLFARFRISNLGKIRIQTYPISASFIWLMGPIEEKSLNLSLKLKSGFVFSFFGTLDQPF